MLYIGVDAHKTSCTMVAKDEGGKMVRRRRFLANEVGWRLAFADFPEGSEVAVESVGYHRPIVRLLRSLGMVVRVIHARSLALIGKSRKKTDWRDAEALADLLRARFFEESYVPCEEIQGLRELTRSQNLLVKDAVKVKNRVHGLLSRCFMETPEVEDLFGVKGRNFLRGLHKEMSEPEWLVLEMHLDQLDALDRLRARLEHEIAKLVLEDEDVYLLLGVDGISVMGAAVLKAEIADVKRFSSRKKMRSNFGLAVSVRNSGDTEHHGHITKQGPGIVRKYLGQAVIHFVKHNPKAHAKYTSICGHPDPKRVGKRQRNFGKGAIAGYMVEVIYSMLTNKTEYQYARPRRVAEKRRELKRLATAKPTP